MIRMPAESIAVEVSVLFTNSSYQRGMSLVSAPCCSTCGIQIIVKGYFECLLTILYLKLTQCDMRQAYFSFLCEVHY